MPKLRFARNPLNQTNLLKDPMSQPFNFDRFTLAGRSVQAPRIVRLHAPEQVTVGEIARIEWNCEHAEVAQLLIDVGGTRTGHVVPLNGHFDWVANRCGAAQIRMVVGSVDRQRHESGITSTSICLQVLALPITMEFQQQYPDALDGALVLLSWTVLGARSVRLLRPDYGQMLPLPFVGSAEIERSFRRESLVLEAIDLAGDRHLREFELNPLAAEMHSITDVMASLTLPESSKL